MIISPAHPINFIGWVHSLNHYTTLHLEVTGSLIRLNFLAIHEQWWDHCSVSIHDCHISVHQLDYWLVVPVVVGMGRAYKFRAISMAGVSWNWKLVYSKQDNFFTERGKYEVLLYSWVMAELTGRGGHTSCSHLVRLGYLYSSSTMFPIYH